MGSALVGHGCFLTFYERKNLTGWSVRLGVGRYTKCTLSAWGVPPVVPGALSVKFDEGRETADMGIRFLPRTHGPSKSVMPIAKGLASFRHFQMNFQVRLENGWIRKAPKKETPILEFRTTGMTYQEAFFSAAQCASRGLNMSGLLRQPLLSLWLAPPRDFGSRCQLMVQLKTADLPESLYPHLETCKLPFTCSEHFSTQVSLGHDLILRVSTEEEEIACPVNSAIDIQQQVELWLGSRLENLPAAMSIEDLRYKLLGPRGPVQVDMPGCHEMVHRGTIPGVIHQIWFGPGGPLQLIDSWRSYSLWEELEHRLWQSETEIQDVLNLSDDLLQDWMRIYHQEHTNAGKADLLRVALLYDLGGVYVDSDALWLGGLLNLSTEFIAGWTDSSQILVQNAFMASAPKGFVVRKLLEMQIQLYQHCRKDLGLRIWDPFGPGILTHIISKLCMNFTDPHAQILKSSAFFPISHSSDPWKQLGQFLPNLAETTGAVSVDLGMSTNKYTPGMDPIICVPLGFSTLIIKTPLL